MIINSESTAMHSDKIKKKMEESRRLMFEKDRLETFNENWKELKGFKFCKPENFAAAGFYNCSSVKFPDNVRCFACQKELSDWEKNDDPWKEHVKRGSKCPYVVFRSKENTTIEDFFQLLLEMKKISINDYFTEQKETLHQEEEYLLKKIKNLQRTKK